MEDLYKLSTAHGIDPLSFYDLSMQETVLAIEGKREKREMELKELIELIAIANRVAIVNANNNSNHTVFKQQEEEIKEVDTETEKEELGKIFNL